MWKMDIQAKSLLVLLTITLFGVCIVGCGDGSGVHPVSSLHSDASRTKGLPAPEPSTGPLSHEDKNDDASIYVYGHAASVAEGRAITAVVNRYYALAAAKKGERACSLLFSTFSRSVAEDYGQGAGPSYLNGGKTCGAVLSLVFNHYRYQLAGAIEVIGVRVKRHHAYALLRSMTLPYRYIQLERERSTWKIADLVGSELP